MRREDRRLAHHDQPIFQQMFHKEMSAHYYSSVGVRNHVVKWQMLAILPVGGLQRASSEDNTCFIWLCDQDHYYVIKTTRGSHAVVDQAHMNFVKNIWIYWKCAKHRVFLFSLPSNKFFKYEQNLVDTLY